MRIKKLTKKSSGVELLDSVLGGGIKEIENMIVSKTRRMIASTKRMKLYIKNRVMLDISQEVA